MDSDLSELQDALPLEDCDSTEMEATSDFSFDTSYEKCSTQSDAHQINDQVNHKEKIAINCKVHVEVCQNQLSTLRQAVIKEQVLTFLHAQNGIYADVEWREFSNPVLKEHVSFIAVVDTDFIQRDNKLIDLSQSQLLLHIYQLNSDGGVAEELDEEDLAAAQHWLLPAEEFHGSWSSLVYESEIKSQLLQYASTMLLFSDHNVDCNLVSWNRVILLHGPPGTGKTSLCKALAHKLCINLSHRYSYGQLIEINSHSLFSKWFSESGKLVMKMFQKIQGIIDDKDALVCVLIDEVESLTAARKSAMAGTEPSDAIRVVNALLTQLDQIKKNSNVIILTTSNITGAIDLAFVDRADIKQYIGLPSTDAIYKIYRSSIAELVKKNILASGDQIFETSDLRLMRFVENDATRLSLSLRKIAERSQGLSGRTLRKIPFLAHALYLQTCPVIMLDFLAAMDKAVTQQFKERELLSSS